MPVFNAKNTIIQIEDASGTCKLVLGPGPGDGAWPDIAEGGMDTAIIKDAGSFLGRVYTEDMEGEVTLSLHHAVSDVARSELFNAIRKVGTWAGATTCDPGGTVWAASVLVRGEQGGNVFALRWKSARIKANGTRALSGNTISLTLSVVGEPLYGADAIAWPS